ncbi:hypothetical protein NPIL_116861 [Nephila pilipes]|uniref:Uncharacterized protein n=1 Tax=Nephila pilipes TaxID=299642 RepID=A0A8X6MI88_NEPPI|nr:hypothetical protein NPIL_116861 [Nephila pilipes]
MLTNLESCDFTNDDEERNIFQERKSREFAFRVPLNGIFQGPPSRTKRSAIPLRLGATAFNLSFEQRRRWNDFLNAQGKKGFIL